jgi:hypothetical protein
MPRVVRSEQMEASDGLIYSVRVCGRLTADARGEGWIEFEPHDGAPALRTRRETTQSSLVDLAHWADTLTDVYLEGALSRARDAVAPRIAVVQEDAPAYDGPAREETIVVTEPVGEACVTNDFVDVEGAVLDPISIYTKSGETVLRERLGALSARHLRGIVRGYRLAPPGADPEVLNEAELTALIVVGVRGRCAA